MNLRYKNYQKIGIVLLLIVFCVFSAIKVDAQESIDRQNDIHLYMFYGQGCPHCNKLKMFLNEIKNKYPLLKIREYEVYQDNKGRELFEKMSKAYNRSIEGVPTVFIDNKVIVGFSNKISVSLENEVKRCLSEECIDPIEKLKSESIEKKIIEESSPIPKEKEYLKKLTIPIVMGAAVVDAINPCAFAVLIILMIAALSITDRKRALKFGLAFAASIYVSYFLMGLGLFSVLQISGLSHTFYIIVTALAVIVGLLNIKDYFWYGKGFLMEVPLSWRPRMKKILNSATTPLGAFMAGLAVSLFELPCTGGPYIVILGLLAEKVTRTTGIFYLLLYNLIFVSPLILLSLVIYKGLSTTSKLEAMRQKKIKLLHLIAGLLMLGIAIVMIISLIKGWV